MVRTSVTACACLMSKLSIFVKILAVLSLRIYNRRTGKCLFTHEQKLLQLIKEKYNKQKLLVGR